MEQNKNRVMRNNKIIKRKISQIIKQLQSIK